MAWLMKMEKKPRQNAPYPHPIVSTKVQLQGQRKKEREEKRREMKGKELEKYASVQRRQSR